MLKKYNIEVNMIFIDFIKKTDELITFLNKCIKIYPNAIIVGDDYVFDTVKQALFEFISQNKYYIGLLPESYILSPNKLEKYNELYKKFSKKDDKDKNNDKVDILKELITSNEFEKAIELIKKYNLDMNEKIYNNENTIYHILAMTLYKINKKDIIKLFEKIQKPEKIENILLLTYDDYLNNNINFS